MDHTLNPLLVEEQNLSKGDIAKITMLHNEKDMLFAEMEKLDADDPSLRSYAEKIQDIEFRMQDAWKWERDAGKHTHWFQAPHCKCPVLDNWDIQYCMDIGIDVDKDNTGRSSMPDDAEFASLRWITSSCPLHGAE